MPRQMSNRERLLRERWPGCRVLMHEASALGAKCYFATATLRQEPDKDVCRTRIWGKRCTTRWSAWRSLKRAMVRTARALEEGK